MPPKKKSKQVPQQKIEEEEIIEEIIEPESSGDEVEIEVEVEDEYEDLQEASEAQPTTPPSPKFSTPTKKEKAKSTNQANSGSNSVKKEKLSGKKTPRPKSDIEIFHKHYNSKCAVKSCWCSNTGAYFPNPYRPTLSVEERRQEEELLIKWIEFADNGPNWVPNLHEKCTREFIGWCHFQEEDIQSVSHRMRGDRHQTVHRLVKGAIPSAREIINKVQAAQKMNINLGKSEGDLIKEDFVARYKESQLAKTGMVSRLGRLLLLERKFRNWAEDELMKAQAVNRGDVFVDKSQNEEVKSLKRKLLSSSKDNGKAKAKIQVLKDENDQLKQQILSLQQEQGSEEVSKIQHDDNSNFYP